MDNLKQELLSNTVWSSIEKFSTIGIQLVCTFIVARFLTPSDFGLLGLLIIFSSFSNCLIESGFSQAIIREKNVKQADYSSILYFNVVLSIIIYLLLFLSAGEIASFFNEPNLKLISRVTFIILPLNALSIVQFTKLTKDLKFKKLCIISLAASLVSSILTIILAYYWHNVWALVFQLIISNFLRTILFWATSDFRPSLVFSLERIKYYFKFSKNLLLSGLIGNIFTNISSLLIGKVYSISDLGFYSQASRLNSVMSQNFTAVIQGVSYPILVKVNNSGGEIKNAYKKIISVTLICVGSLMALILIVASDLFELLMGYEWRIAGVYLLLLGLDGILYPLHSINQNILLVKGNSKKILGLEIFRRIIMVIILLIVLRYNVYVFSAGLSIYSFVLLFVNMYFCGQPIQYSLKAQLEDIFPILLKIGIVVILGCFLNYFVAEWHLIIRLFVCLSFGISLLLVSFYKESNMKIIFELIHARLFR